MNKLNHTEQDFKDILESMDFEVDSNEIWSSIESDVPSKEKKRFGWLFFTAIGLLLGTTISFLWLRTSDSNITDHTPTSISQPLSSTKKTTPIATTQIIQNPTLESKEGLPFNKNKIHTNTQIFQNTKNTNTDQNTIITPVVHKPQANNILIPSSIRQSATIEKTQIKSTTQNTKNITRKKEITANTNEFHQINTITQGVSNTRINLIAAPKIESVTLALLDINNTPIDRHNRDMIKPLRTYSALFYGIKTGLNRNISTITSIKSNSEFDSSEFDLEKDRYGQSTNLFAGIQRANGWRFTIAASYHQYVSTYSRDDIILYKDAVTGIAYYKIEADGTILSQQGQTSVNKVQQNDISWNRQHKAIDLQVSAGKRIWSFKGFSWNIDMGVGYNVYTSHNGYYLEDSSFGFTKINTDHPYKSSTSWNMISSTDLSYDFGKIKIGVSPFIRWNPNSITNTKHFYQLNNSQVGMQLLLTYSPTRE